MILDVKTFSLSDVDHGGTKKYYACLTGAIAGEDKPIEAVLWNADAINLDKTLSNLVPDGMELTDMDISVQLDGNYTSRWRTVAGERVFQSHFSVEENGFQVLTGPAAELRRQKSAASEALQKAAGLESWGNIQEAYQTLLKYMESFADRKVVIQATLEVPDEASPIASDRPSTPDATTNDPAPVEIGSETPEEPSDAEPAVQEVADGSADPESEVSSEPETPRGEERPSASSEPEEDVLDTVQPDSVATLPENSSGQENKATEEAKPSNDPQDPPAVDKAASVENESANDGPSRQSTKPSSPRPFRAIGGGRPRPGGGLRAAMGLTGRPRPSSQKTTETLPQKSPEEVAATELKIQGAASSLQADDVNGNDYEANQIEQEESDRSSQLSRPGNF